MFPGSLVDQFSVDGLVDIGMYDCQKLAIVTRESFFLQGLNGKTAGHRGRGMRFRFLGVHRARRGELFLHVERRPWVFSIERVGDDRERAQIVPVPMYWIDCIVCARDDDMLVVSGMCLDVNGFPPGSRATATIRPSTGSVELQSTAALVLGERDNSVFYIEKGILHEGMVLNGRLTGGAIGDARGHDVKTAAVEAGRLFALGSRAILLFEAYCPRIEHEWPTEMHRVVLAGRWCFARGLGPYLYWYDVLGGGSGAHELPSGRQVISVDALRSEGAVKAVVGTDSGIVQVFTFES